MNNQFFIEFKTAKDVISLLDKKYQDKSTIGSKKRFPASLIFFSSKKQYKQFLEQCPWTIHHMSEIFASDQLPSEFKIKNWFKKELNESIKRPVVITPMTEFIRIYQSHPFSQIMDQIIQSEGHQLIIPMLDFFEKYQQFIETYIHKQRMAEVFAQNETDIDDDRDIEIIFDKTGQVTIASGDVVKTPRDWVSLWETGDIAVKKRLLIQNEIIVDIVETTDISIPKIKKIPIHSIKDYLQYEFSINQATFCLEPNSEILDFIRLNKEQIRGPNFWDELEKTIFPNNVNFEDLLFRFWESSHHEGEKINRWFWLNKAKSDKVQGAFLNEIIQKIDDPEKLIDQIYFEGLDKSQIAQEILKERRGILVKFTNPLFFNDVSTLERKFQHMLEVVNNDPEQLINRLVGIFEFERKIIVKTIPKLLDSEKQLPITYFKIIKQIWPEFAYYIEPSLTCKPIRSFDFNKEFSDFANVYRDHYIRSKTMFDHPTEEIDLLQKEFREKWQNIIAAKKLGKIDSYSSTKLNNELKDKKYIFFDAIGYEWGNLLKYLFEKRGWTVLEILPLFASLPSITKYFPFRESEFEIDEFDQLIHKNYEYPDTIEKEIHSITTIVEKQIHQKFKGYSQPIWIISDHGSTVFARKGSSLKNFKNENKRHGGRYSVFDDEQILATDDLKIVSQGDEKYLISTTYDNIGKTKPIGEAHGGATPEEIIAIAIKVIPPAGKTEGRILSVETDKLIYSPLDEFISITITTTIEEKISEIKMDINDSPKFSVSDYYKQRILNIPLKYLKEKGLKVGINSIHLSVNDRESRFDINLESGSVTTGFDEKFKF